MNNKDTNYSADNRSEVIASRHPIVDEILTNPPTNFEDHSNGHSDHSDHTDRE